MNLNIRTFFFDVTKKCLVGEGWCPVFAKKTVFAKKQIQNILNRATVACNSSIGAIFHVLQSKEQPPTYFCTNSLAHSELSIVFYQKVLLAWGIRIYLFLSMA